MEYKQKRVAVINDISGFGRCALTTTLPILSVTGIETSVIPTAILSTHTGGFENYTFRDLTEDMMHFAHHWKSLGIGFDAMFSGYLGSFEQLTIVSSIFELFKSQDNFIFVDHIMADNGILYEGFDKSYPAGMAKFCAHANAITPNMTEACLLLGKEYREGPYSSSDIETLLKQLSELGPEKVFLTGVSFRDGELGAAAFDRSTGEIVYAFSEQIPGFYVGTGDVFASALLAALLSDCRLQNALHIAVHFTAEAILRSKEEGTDPRFGVNFESGLTDLARALSPSYSKRKTK